MKSRPTIQPGPGAAGDPRQADRQIFKTLSEFARYSFLPILLSLYPAFFHYANNPGSAIPVDLINLVLGFGLIGLLVYGVWLVALRGRSLQASLAASIFLVFFHTYGILFRALKNWDIVRLEHYSFLPLVVALAIYAAWAISHAGSKRSSSFWHGSIIIVGLLVGLNLFRIASAEMTSAAAHPAQPETGLMWADLKSGQRRPDIYYFIYDEMAGFESMRDYWHNSDVDQLAAFLEANGFYVAEQSHSSSIDTLQELATRLNYREFKPNEVPAIYFDAIADSKAMQYLKSLGYTTVAFEEMRMSLAYPAAPPMKADILYGAPSGPVRSIKQGPFNEFTLMAADNTLLAPFLAGIRLSVPNAAVAAHKDMVFFTTQKVTQLDEISGPKFVFVHLLLPHSPFLFQADGGLNAELDFYSWDYYLGNYQFAEYLIEKTVEGILAAEDPQNLPVIIISSDHGARNLPIGSGPILPHFPEKYKTLIVNALYLPGCDQSMLTQDMNPINTLPIVFNCYFDANIPLK